MGGDTARRVLINFGVCTDRPTDRNKSIDREKKCFIVVVALLAFIVCVGAGQSDFRSSFGRHFHLRVCGDKVTALENDFQSAEKSVSRSFSSVVVAVGVAVVFVVVASSS